MGSGVHLVRSFARTESIGMNGVYEPKLPYSFVETFSKLDILCPYQKTLKCQNKI